MERSPDADGSLDFLNAFEYFGRAIIMGVEPEGKHAVVGYMLTGRSAPSKARRLEAFSEHGFIQTMATRAEVVEQGNPSLLLYTAIDSCDGRVTVSNGAQSMLLYNTLRTSRFFNMGHIVLAEAFARPFYVADTKYGRVDITSSEPDAPNFTPRISGVLTEQGYALSHASVERGLKITDIYGLNSGRAHFLATYAGPNKDPIPSSMGTLLAFTMPAAPTVEDFVTSIAAVLAPKRIKDKPTLVGVAAAYVDLETRAVSLASYNTYQKGEMPA